MSTFSPEAIAQIAAVILSHNPDMTFQSACAQSHNLLIAAERSNAERAAVRRAAQTTVQE